MLCKVIRPDQEAVSFGYDALGRRLWKRYGNTITKWVWDGNKPLHEWKEHALTGAILSDTTVDSDGIITWLFEEDSFAPVAKLKGEKKYSIITDHLGTPSQMYNEEGKLFWQGSLDSYGRMRMERGEMGSCPFRYQGQYEDKEIGLYYNRFRYYSPQEGMYISQDPIGLEGGNKVYGYVKDTSGWIDALGLSSYRVDKKTLNKILWGKRKTPGKKDVIGGHFSGISNHHPKYAVSFEGYSNINPSCKKIKYYKELSPGEISKIKSPASTLFPEGWSKKTIKNAIEEVANNPASSITNQISGGYIINGNYRGVNIDVTLDDTRKITGAYPK